LAQLVPDLRSDRHLGDLGSPAAAGGRAAEAAGPGTATPARGPGRRPGRLIRRSAAHRVIFRAEDSPSGLWRSLGKRVGLTPSGVRIPYPPPGETPDRFY